MTGFRWSKKSAMLTALGGSMLLGAYPVRAQTGGIQEQVEAVLEAPRQAELNRYYTLLAAGLHDTADEMLGATLQPVGDTLRAQLGIPAGQGLVVEVLRGEGASAQAGLQQNDVLLSLADKPLATADDLIKHLKAAGDSPVALRILRAGTPVTIRVRPIYRVTLGPVGEQKTEYFIGISVVGPNDAVRAQLGLGDGKGMVVTEVESGSPAEKAGVKKYDIVLELDGKPIDSPESLQRQVQAAQGHPATLKILRAAKPMTVSVTPGMRKVEMEFSVNRISDHRLLFLQQSLPAQVRSIDYALGLERFTQPAPADADDLRQRLDHVEKELKSVRAALDKINETLKANKGTKRD